MLPKITSTILIAFYISSILLAQDGELPEDQKIGKHTVAEWNVMVDTTWGDGLSTSDKLLLFDRFWEAADKYYPGFVNRDPGWDSLRNVYRPEIEAGVSRGRFAAILWQLSRAIREPHSGAADLQFFAYEFTPEMPVMIYRYGRTWLTPGYTDDGWFGATVTAVDEDHLIVLKCLPGHPLDLQPGDQVVGYDGIAWKELYPMLLRLELPQQVNAICGTEEADKHSLLSGVGMNWHLFDTIDIIKYGSSDTQHLPTSLLEAEKQYLFGSEQLPVNGVPFPGDLTHSGMHTNLPRVLYGTIENTHIGYIYILHTSGDETSQDLKKAIDAVTDENTEGLIFDVRWNPGGSFFWETGFNRIFNRTIDSCGFYARTAEGDYNQLQKVKAFSWREEVFEELSDEFLNKPVALLIGPGAMSNGDYIAYFIHCQPMSRSFGRSSKSAYTMGGNANEINTPACLTNANLYNNRAIPWNMGFAGYATQVAGRNFGRIIDGKLVTFLQHGYEIDEGVWFTQEGAHNQTDDMVERAVEWIRSVAYADSCRMLTFSESNQNEILIQSGVVNPKNHNIELHSKIYDTSGKFVNDISMVENSDGTIEGLESDEWYGKIEMEQGFYFAEVSTYDIDENSILTYPGMMHFTTAEKPEIYPQAVEVETGSSLTIPVEITNTSEIDFGEVTLKYSCIEPHLGIQPSLSSYGMLTAGDLTEKTITLTLDSTAEPSSEFRIDLEISVDDIAYWKDSIMVTGVTGTQCLPEISSGKLLTYPNPMNEYCMIRMTDNTDIRKIELCDLSGRVIFIKDQIRSSTYRLNRENLKSGMYFLRVFADEIYLDKIIVR